MIKLLLLLLLVQSVYASEHEFGNGGHAVICDSNGYKNYELLDIYEARQKGESFIGDGLNSAGVHKQVHSHLAEMSKLNGLLRYFYTTSMLLNINKYHDRFFTQNEIPLVSDYGHIELQENCYLTQFAAHKNNVEAFQKSFVVNHEYYTKVGMLSRIGIWHHEVIYNYMRTVFMNNNSNKSRKLVQMHLLDKEINLNSIKQELASVGVYPSKSLLIDNGARSKIASRRFFWKKGYVFNIGEKKCALQEYIHEKSISSSGKIKNTIKILSKLSGQDTDCNKQKTFFYYTTLNKEEVLKEAIKTVNILSENLLDHHGPDGPFASAAVEIDLRIKYSNYGDFYLFPFQKIQSSALIISKK